nr:restriction endonuclease [uncultured Pedobacter sp.]
MEIILISLPLWLSISGIIIGILILSFLPYFYIRSSVKQKRHKRNISNGEKIILKLRSFNGEFKNQRILTYLRKVNPYVFEELVLTALEQKNHIIHRNKSYSGDGGIDGIVFNANKRLLIQVKRYQGNIKSSHLSDFNNLIQQNGAHGGYFIHTGKTSAKSYQNFKGTQIEIISGQKLIDLILYQKPILATQHNNKDL